MNQTALVIIKSMGIGDLVILKSNIDAISNSIKKKVVVLAQKNTRAAEILKHESQNLIFSFINEIALVKSSISSTGRRIK